MPGQAPQVALDAALGVDMVEILGQQVTPKFTEINGSVEQVAMCAGTGKTKFKGLLVAIPDQEPIGPDMAFPASMVFPLEHMRTVPWCQRLIGYELGNDLLKLLNG